MTSSPNRLSFLSRIGYGLAYSWDRAFKTGKRRAEYEYKYATHGDYFAYRSRPYETKKYQDTLRVVLRERRARTSILETGCSVGVFTQLLAQEFDEVVATDISGEALRLAAETVGPVAHVTYVRSEVEAINLGRGFDVIMVAEVLLFVKERDSERLLSVLDRHLSDNGVIVEVANANRPTNEKFFFGWDRIISSRFPIVCRERHDDPTWPYEIVVYQRLGAQTV